jgi:hypothetical protein
MTTVWLSKKSLSSVELRLRRRQPLAQYGNRRYMPHSEAVKRIFLLIGSFEPHEGARHLPSLEHTVKQVSKHTGTMGGLNLEVFKVSFGPYCISFSGHDLIRD